MMLQALLEGFGGKTAGEKEVEVSPEALSAMQDSAVAAIAAKAGSRLPITRGRDKNLPRTPPMFDFEELRKRNEAILDKRKVP